MKKISRITIRDLVQALQDCTRSDEEVVAVIEHLMRTRRLRRLRPVPVHAA